ncbi:hypothetical protein K1T71_015315 [Dendrolimus kikuchii]|nr:hypothetical protein K1T71_015315 [Dendrolimus kikuchii]
MEAIQESQAEIMMMFQQRMAQFENDLKNSSGSSQGSSNIASLSSEFSTFKNFVTQALGNLQRQIELLFQNIDRIEMHTRRKILLVHGVPESKEDLAKSVVKVLQEHLKVPSFSEAAIRRCHRMGRQHEAKKPRPILVKFQEMSTRNDIWFSKTSLKGTGITISEFMTKHRHGIFIAARQKFGIGKCWTRDGLVYVLGPDGTQHRINSLAELSSISEVITPQQVASEVPVKTTAAAPPRAKRTNTGKK